MVITGSPVEMAFHRFDNHIKGDTYDGNTFELTDAETGDPIDLTDVVEIKIQFKLTPTSSAALTFSLTGGEIEITDAVNSKFDILPQIVDIPAGEYLSDFEFTYSSGKIKTYVKASWKIIQDITNG